MPWSHAERAHVGTWRRAGAGGDRAGRADGPQRLRHRLRRALGGAAAGAELRRRRGAWPARSRWPSSTWTTRRWPAQSAHRRGSAEQGLGRGAGHHPGDVTFPACPPGRRAPARTRAFASTCFATSERRQPAADVLRPARRHQRAGRAGDGDRGSAVWRLDRLREAVRDSRQVARERATTRAPPGWSEDDTFERYVQNGSNAGSCSARPTTTRPRAQAGGSYRPNGTGFTRDSTASAGRITAAASSLKAGNPNQAIAPGWYHPVVINSDRRARRRQLSRQHRHL